MMVHLSCLVKFAIIRRFGSLEAAYEARLAGYVADPVMCPVGHNYLADGQHAHLALHRTSTWGWPTWKSVGLGIAMLYAIVMFHTLLRSLALQYYVPLAAGLLALVAGLTWKNRLITDPIWAPLWLFTLFFGFRGMAAVVDEYAISWYRIAGSSGLALASLIDTLETRAAIAVVGTFLIWTLGGPMMDWLTVSLIEGMGIVCVDAMLVAIAVVALLPRTFNYEVVTEL